MSEQIPQPPHPVDAARAWNEQPREARLSAIAQAAVQSLISVDPEGTVKNEADSGEREFSISDFWEKGYAAEMPTIADAIADSKRHPEKYSTIIRKQPSKLTGYFHDTQGKFSNETGSTLDMTERDALADMERFLTDAESTAERLGLSDTAQEVRELAENTGYLSETDFDKAADTLAAAWQGYLEASDKNIINLHVLSPDISSSREKKSQGLVTDRVLGSMRKRIEGNPALADRFITDPEQWRDGEGALLVAVDDWTISGSQRGGNVRWAQEAAKAAGQPGLVGKTELHLLAAPKDRLDEVQSLDSDSIEDIKFVTRSVFVHDTGRNVHEFSMTGWHSSVDYGFETAISRITSAIADKGQAVLDPHLTRIDRRYRPEYTDEALRRVDWQAISGRIAEQKKLHSDATALKAEKDELNAAYMDINDLDGRRANSERRAEIQDGLSDIYRKNNAIEDEKKEVRSTLGGQ